MVIIKDKFSYKRLKIKYRVIMDKTDLLGTDVYEMSIYYEIGFFGKVEIITLGEAWSAKEGTVEEFINKWKNISKDELNEIAINAIKEKIDKQLKKEEDYEELEASFKK